MAGAANASDEDVREALMRADAMRQQLSGLESQRELLADLMQEAKRSITTLEGVEKGTDGDELLVPVGAGTFLRATLADASRAITTLGSGVHADLPIPEARQRLSARVENLDASAKRISGEISRLVQELDRINMMLESQSQG